MNADIVSSLLVLFVLVVVVGGGVWMVVGIERHANQMIRAKAEQDAAAAEARPGRVYRALPADKRGGR